MFLLSLRGCDTTSSFPSACDLTGTVLSTFSSSTFLRPILDNRVVLLDVFVPFFPCSYIKSKINSKSVAKNGLSYNFQQLERIIRERRIKVTKQLSVELATKFYQASANRRKQSIKPKGYHSWKNQRLLLHCYDIS